MEVRINKFLADKGVASRRAIDVLIAEKRITVNGVPLGKPGLKVSEMDDIAIDGKKIVTKSKKNVYILLNKPTECITSVSDTHGRDTVLDYVQVKERIFPIGRLDKDTTGVLLLTNDGELANVLMHPRYSVEKVYRAHLDKSLTEKDKQRFESGIFLDGKKTAHSETRFFGNGTRDVIVTLHEGRNRQIHRMFGALKYTVEKLDRISYAGLTASDLKRGEWRYLSKPEVDALTHIQE